MIDRVLPASTALAPALSAPEATAARGVAPASSAEASSIDFGAMLGDLIASTASTLRNAEAASIAGTRGQASVQQIVEAVMSAEQTLQATIAVRDKVVSAYLELSRMQI
jgi:flagellar hook-basal body complex protein FliE